VGEGRVRGGKCCSYFSPDPKNEQENAKAAKKRDFAVFVAFCSRPSGIDNMLPMWKIAATN
jgi:hypothetical protein